MDWSTHFPAFVDADPAQTNLAGARKLVKDVEVVDIGCGFGGLLVGLAPVLPDTLMVGEFDLDSFCSLLRWSSIYMRAHAYIILHRNGNPHPSP